MKFSVLGLLLLVPAFGQFQFVQDVAGNIKNAVETSVHAVENVAKDGIHQVQKLGNQIGQTVKNTFSPPQAKIVPSGPIPGPIPNQPLAVNVPITMEIPKQMKTQISEVSKQQRPQKHKRPSKDHKKPRKQSFSDSDSASDSESDSENEKIQKSQKNHPRRKQQHGHQRPNPEMRKMKMMKCQQRLNKAIEQFKKMQQEHKKQGKQIHEDLINKNKQEIQRLNNKIQRLMRRQKQHQNRVQNSQRPDRVRIDRQINVKFQGNTRQQIVHERVEITNNQQIAGQQNFRQRRGQQRGQKRNLDNQNNKQMMQQMIRVKRNPYEHHGEMKRNVEINDQTRPNQQRQIPRAHKVFNEDNVMSGKRHVRKQAQEQKLQNAEIKDINENKQVNNEGVELIILN